MFTYEKSTAHFLRTARQEPLELASNRCCPVCPVLCCTVPQPRGDGGVRRAVPGPRGRLPRLQHRLQRPALLLAGQKHSGQRQNNFSIDQNWIKLLYNTVCRVEVTTSRLGTGRTTSRRSACAGRRWSGAGIAPGPSSGCRLTSWRDSMIRLLSRFPTGGTARSFAWQSQPSPVSPQVLRCVVLSTQL